MDQFYTDSEDDVAISASGNSSNLVKVVNFTKEQKLTSISLTGFDGGCSGRYAI
jgi:phosphoheptose isomerase